MAVEEREDPSGKRGFIFSAFPKDATPVFWAALVVGVTFVCLPTVFRTYFAVNGTQSNLVICIGAGIILAAFGGQANFQMKGVVFVGAAAIAFGLFWYLQHVSHKLFLEGTLNFYDLDKYQSLSIENRHTVLGAAKANQDNLKRSSYEFVIVKNQIVDERIVVALVTRENKREVSVFVEVGEIEWAFGETRRLQWELRDRVIDGKVVPSIYDTYKRKFVSDERTAVRQSDVRFASMPSWTIVREAAAQDAAAKVGVDVLLERLKSDETPIRRGARRELSDVSVATLPTILKTYREEYSDYQVRLGVNVALSQALRADKSKAKSMSEVMTVGDIDLFLRSASEPDQTMRIYATEFLFELGDPRVAKMAVERAATTADENARYNLLYSAQGGWAKLSDLEKRALTGSLVLTAQRSGERTKALIEKLK